MTPIEQQRARYYNPTPYVNLNPNAAQNLLGNFFTRNAAANNAMQYRNPQYQGLPMYNGQQVMIPSVAQVQGNQALAPYVAGAQNFVNEYVTPQLIQNALLATGAGATVGGVIGRVGLPLAIMGASKLGQPVVNAVNKVANSPVGKWGAKLIDWAF